jgi:hypothetical protein
MSQQAHELAYRQDLPKQERQPNITGYEHNWGTQNSKNEGGLWYSELKPMASDGCAGEVYGRVEWRKWRIWRKSYGMNGVCMWNSSIKHVFSLLTHVSNL